MDDDQDRGADHKRRDNGGDSLYRTTYKLTSDDATVIGICVNLPVILMGALVCIVCFGLLIVLLTSGFICRHLKPQTCL
jgi:hypothetical protein